jgi:hypothetical protein
VHCTKSGPTTNLAHGPSRAAAPPTDLASSWAWAGVSAAHMGWKQVWSTSFVRFDWIAMHQSRPVKITESAPSEPYLTLVLSLSSLRHNWAHNPIEERSGESAKTMTPPPQAPSPMRVSTDGWMYHRRVDPRWVLLCVRSFRSRSGGD